MSYSVDYTTTRILDGGLAYALELKGFQNIDDDPLWTSRFLHTNPEEIKDVHKRFLEAGASVVLTASYQASVGGFREHLKVSEQEAIELIMKSTRLAREACDEVYSQGTCPDPVPLVAGSVGPYGACLHDGSEYTGSYVERVTKQEFQDWHRPRIQALIESGVDLVAVETIPAQKEAEAILNLLDTEFPNAKVYVTYCCKDGRYTCHGEELCAAIVPVIQSDCVIGVGVNCTSPDHVTPLLKSIQSLTNQKAVIVKANSGQQYESGRGWLGREHCTPVHTFTQEWLSLGATWLGGCCHVFPDDISMIKKEVSKWKTLQDST